MSTKTSKDFIVERSTTRLYAPPGGKTSICLGGYDAEPAPRQRVNNLNNASTLSFSDSSVSASTQQQPTSMNSARGKGNQSTLSFGDYKDSPQKTTGRKPVPLINITNVDQLANANAANFNNNNVQKPATASSSSGRPGDSHNNIFGQNDVKASVRVRQAPGGASTIFFG